MTSLKRTSNNYISQNKKAKASNNTGIFVKDVKEGLKYLKQLFPLEAFQHKLPPIVMHHQLYSLLPNRTLVDKQVNELKNAGEIRLFRLGEVEEEYALVFLDDFCDHVLKTTGPNPTIEAFLEKAVKKYPDISYSKELLIQKLKFQEADISELIRCGVLTLRDLGLWWLALPRAGFFVTALAKGRRMLLAALKRTQYKEMLEQDLLARPLHKSIRFSCHYLLHDLVGADYFTCIPTTSGRLLRLQKST